MGNGSESGGDVLTLLEKVSFKGVKVVLFGK